MRICVLYPGSSHVWRTVVEHDVRFPVFQFISEEVTTVNGSDIGSESRDTWNWLDGYQVNAYRGTLTNVPWARNIGRTDDETIHWHRFACDLKPTSRRSTKIYATARRLQERVFFIQLDQLECGACTVPLLSARSQVSRSWVKRSSERTLQVCSTCPADLSPFSSVLCPS